MDDGTLGLWLLAGIGIFLLAMSIGYGTWVLGVRFLAWRLKKKAPSYANDARSGYAKIMVSMTRLGWITKKEAGYQNFNFGMDMWKAEEAGKRLEELNAKLAQLAKDLEEAGDMAQAELTAAHTELAGVEIPDMMYVEKDGGVTIADFKDFEIDRNIHKRQPLPDDVFYLEHPFPEPAFVPIQEHKHKHKYKLAGVGADNDYGGAPVKVYTFKCTIEDCQYEYFVMDSWLWGKEAS